MKFYDLESEQIILAGVLSDESKLLACIEAIPEDIFYDEFFKNIYSLIIKSYKKYNSIIVPSSIKKLVDDNTKSIEMKEKCTYLIAKYKDKSVNDIEFKIAIESIKKLYIKRKFLDTSDFVVSNLNDGDIHTLYLALEDTLISTKTLINPELISKEGDVSDFEDRIKIYSDIKDNPDMFKGVSSGWDELDLLTGGFQPGELVLILGKQGGGKSMALLNIAYSAWEKNCNVIYFTLEMPKLQIERRFDSRLTSTFYHNIKTGKFTTDELESFKVKLDKELTNRKNKFYIVDIPSGCDSMLLSSKVKQLSRKFKIDLIVIDYLGLIYSSVSKGKDLWQSTLNVANELKEMSRNFNIPVVTASQVTTEGMKKKAKDSFELHDIALTRRLADPCDIILGLNWDEAVNQIYISVVKYRDGKGPVMKLFADMDRCLITNFSDDLDEE